MHETRCVLHHASYNIQPPEWVSQPGLLEGYHMSCIYIYIYRRTRDNRQGNITLYNMLFTTLFDKYLIPFDKYSILYAKYAILYHAYPISYTKQLILTLKTKLSLRIWTVIFEKRFPVFSARPLYQNVCID